MLRELSVSKPDLLIVHYEDEALKTDREINAFVLSNYNLAPFGKVNAYVLWVRKGSALEARMWKMAKEETRQITNSSAP